jgi:hypothetical protein
LAVISVALPAFVVWVWTRCRGGAVLTNLQRIGLVVCCQLAALLLAAAAVNDYAYFFTSWPQLGMIAGELIGSPPSNTASTRTHAEAPGARGGSVTIHSAGGNALSHLHYGQLESVTVAGATGLHENGFVYLPPQYFQPRYAHASFPGVELLTGFPGSPLNIVRRLDYPTVLRDLIRKHRAEPMVLVMLNTSPRFPRDTECTDIPDGPQVLTYLAQDVPYQISRTYRVRPTAWGVGGDSTGGYCATKIAMTHPLTFAAGVSLSGYYFALHDDTTGDLWARSQAIRDLNDLKWRLRHLPAPPISLLLTTSYTERGEDGLPEARSFMRLRKPPLTIDTLILAQGGHNLKAWSREVPTAVTWLSRRLAHVPGVAS